MPFPFLTHTHIAYISLGAKFLSAVWWPRIILVCSMYMCVQMYFLLLSWMRVFATIKLAEILLCRNEFLQDEFHVDNHIQCQWFFVRLSANNNNSIKQKLLLRATQPMSIQLCEYFDWAMNRRSPKTPWLFIGYLECKHSQSNMPYLKCRKQKSKIRTCIA